MDTPRRAQLVIEMLQHAVNGRHDDATSVLAQIAQACDGQQMYGVCCGVADAARQSLIRLFGEPSRLGLWALAAPDPAEGPEHPAHTFAMRFVSAFANDDQDTCQALYLAAMRASANDFAHSVTALVGITAHITRTAVEELAADSEKPSQHPH
ncbi:hypothetical protein [Streptomyces spiralis]|uniref:hypothetical protein n=1 Tax=Streptomyces spiralis TaxID=66376 RepID=UPI003400FC4D